MATGNLVQSFHTSLRISPKAAQAQITKRVYPHLLRHAVATTLLERGMPIEQMQKFLGHSKLETTQL
jgi:integrase/recombinase XerD